MCPKQPQRLAKGGGARLLKSGTGLLIMCDQMHPRCSRRAICRRFLLSMGRALRRSKVRGQSQHKAVREAGPVLWQPQSRRRGPRKARSRTQTRDALKRSSGSRSRRRQRARQRRQAPQHGGLGAPNLQPCRSRQVPRQREAWGCRIQLGRPHQGLPKPRPRKRRTASRPSR